MREAQALPQSFYGCDKEDHDQQTLREERVNSSHTSAVQSLTKGTDESFIQVLTPHQGKNSNEVGGGADDA